MPRLASLAIAVRSIIWVYEGNLKKKFKIPTPSSFLDVNILRYLSKLFAKTFNFEPILLRFELVLHQFTIDILCKFQENRFKIDVRRVETSIFLSKKVTVN